MGDVTGEVIPLFPLATPLFPGIVLPLEIFEPRYRRLVRDLMALPEDSDRRFFGVTAIRQGWEVEQVAPAAALYDIGCTARLQAVAPRSDGGFRIITVGGDRFRLLEVLVGDDPPYLRAEVAWLAEEEATAEAEATEAAAGRTGPPPDLGETATADPGVGNAVVGDTGVGDSVADAVARGAMQVLVGNVGDLFARYVAEVAALRLGLDHPSADRAGADVDLGDDLGDDLDDDDAQRIGSRTAALLAEVADDPRALSYLVASAALLTTEDRQALLAIAATRRRLASESRLLRRELTLLQTLGAVPAPLREFPAPTTVN
jgi:ATP-dependent Lon protease